MFRRRTVPTVLGFYDRFAIVSRNDARTDADRYAIHGEIYIFNDGGSVVARRGSIARGVISDSDQGGRVSGLATLSLALTDLTLADGSQIQISTNIHSIILTGSLQDLARTWGALMEQRM